MELPTHNDRSSHAKESIDLSYQSLQAFPSEVLRLHHLKTLRLDNNALEEVPWSSLMAIKSLTHVNLSYNKLKELPVILAEWHTIELLDVSHNRIEDITPALYPLFRRAELIIEASNARTSIRCPVLTAALVEHFGDSMPLRVRMHRYSAYAFRRPSAFIDARNSLLPTVTYYTGQAYYNPSTSENFMLRKREWQFVAAQAPRVKLADNPLIAKYPELDGHDWSKLATKWQTSEDVRKTIAVPTVEVDSSEEDDPKLLMKEKRANTRLKRRQQRAKSKAHGGERDEKRDLP